MSTTAECDGEHPGTSSSNLAGAPRFHVSTGGGKSLATLERFPPARYLVLSPHLDDAVLSCGLLLGASPGPSRVTTLFTDASKTVTLSARAFLRDCQADDAHKLYLRRRDEDARALASAGADAIHLGLQDALFRERSGASAGVGRLLRPVPEMRTVYPTYRFHIGIGRVSSGDEQLVADAAAVIAGLAADSDVVLAPYGVGRHVDHLLTRQVADRIGIPNLVYYADQPYASAHPNAEVGLTLAGYTTVRFTGGDRSVKRRLIATYETQTRALFGGQIPDLPETYLLPNHMVTRQ